MVAVKTAPSFVDSLWEMFGPLLAGATPAFLPPRAVLSPHTLVAALRALRVTHYVSVPSLLRLLVQADQQGPGHSWDQAEHERQQQQQGDQVVAGGMQAGTDAQQQCTSGHKGHQGHQLLSSLPLRLLVSSGEPLSRRLASALARALPPACQLVLVLGEIDCREGLHRSVQRLKVRTTKCTPTLPSCRMPGGVTAACAARACRAPAPAACPPQGRVAVSARTQARVLT